MKKITRILILIIMITLTLKAFEIPENFDNLKITKSINFEKYPLPKELVSISNGGLLDDKIAKKDGLGVILLGKLNSNVDSNIFYTEEENCSDGLIYENNKCYLTPVDEICDGGTYDPNTKTCTLTDTSNIKFQKIFRLKGDLFVAESTGGQYYYTTLKRILDYIYISSLDRQYYWLKLDENNILNQIDFLHPVLLTEDGYFINKEGKLIQTIKRVDKTTSIVELSDKIENILFNDNSYFVFIDENNKLNIFAPDKHINPDDYYSDFLIFDLNKIKLSDNYLADKNDIFSVSVDNNIIRIIDKNLKDYEFSPTSYNPDTLYGYFAGKREYTPEDTGLIPSNIKEMVLSGTYYDENVPIILDNDGYLYRIYGNTDKIEKFLVERDADGNYNVTFTPNENNKPFKATTITPLIPNKGYSNYNFVTNSFTKIVSYKDGSLINNEGIYIQEQDTNDIYFYHAINNPHSSDSYKLYKLKVRDDSNMGVTTGKIVDGCNNAYFLDDNNVLWKWWSGDGKEKTYFSNIFLDTDERILEISCGISLMSINKDKKLLYNFNDLQDFYIGEEVYPASCPDGFVLEENTGRCYLQ